MRALAGLTEAHFRSYGRHALQICIFDEAVVGRITITAEPSASAWVHHEWVALVVEDGLFRVELHFDILITEFNSITKL